MAISDWELWACANEILRQQGEGAAAHAERRIEALLLEGDIEGARTWMAIMRRIEQFERPPGRALQ